MLVIVYVDTNGDNSVSPIDVLHVVNFLNDRTGNPEGEFSDAHIDLALVGIVDDVLVTAVAAQDGDVSDLHDSAAISVVSVVARDASLHEPSRPVNGSTIDKDDDDLMAAIDAFFGDFGTS